MFGKANYFASLPSKRSVWLEGARARTFAGHGRIFGPKLLNEFRRHYRSSFVRAARIC